MPKKIRLRAMTASSSAIVRGACLPLLLLAPTALAGCPADPSPDESDASTGTTVADDSTGPEVDGGSTSTSGGPSTSTSNADSSSGGSSSSGVVEGCGDGLVADGEACDDANADEADGCLSDCTVPRTCAEILAAIPGAASGTYILVPDGMSLDAYCEMEADGGGWTLVAKVNDAETDDLPEPLGWFDMTIAPDALLTPEFVLDAGLAAHGAHRFSDLLGPASVARFEVAAADQLDLRATWYKAIASAESFSGWFAADPTMSQVCRDVDMTLDCADGDIASDNGLVLIDHMSLVQYGYTPGRFCTELHMRLDPDPDGAPSGVASCTVDVDWPTSYTQYWGNALLIWLREA